MKTKTFEEKLSGGKILEPGSRNNNIPVIVKAAKECGLELEEALNRLQTLWPMEQTDINSFRKAWPNFEPDVKMSAKDIISGAIKKRTEVSQAQESIDNEVKFIDWLGKNSDGYVDWWKQHSPKLEAKDSSVFQKIFNKNDIVWTGRNVEADTGEMRDLVDYEGESLESTNFFVINPFRSLDSRRNDDEVKCFKHMLLESDHLKLGDQLILWECLIERGLPVKSVVHTGGKSIHCLIEVRDLESIEEYRGYFMQIKKLMDEVKPDMIDEKCKNPSRLSRTPFAIRWKEEENEFGDIEKRGKQQKLMYLNEKPPKNDALEIIREWVEELIGKKERQEQEQDEIDDNEILKAVRGSRIKDIWMDNKDKFCVMLFNPEEKRYEVVSFNQGSFWALIRDTLKDTFHQDFKIEELRRGYIARYKTAFKKAYVGLEEPVRRDRVNMFIPGWLQEALDDQSIPSTLDRRLEIYLKNLFGDDESMNWTLQWMRKFMHDFKVMTAPVFWGNPGVGKSMLAEAFGEAIGDWINTPLNMDDMKFNDWLHNTVIIFEESSSGSKLDGKKLGDILKDWITSDEVTIESKGKDPIKVKAQRCFIFNANINESFAPVYIEDKDRRFTVIKNENGVNLTTLWSGEDYEWWKTTGRKQLMKYIYMMPEDPSVDLSKGLDNKAKQEVQAMAKPNVDSALEDFLETHAGMQVTATEIVKELSEARILTNAVAIGRKMRARGYEHHQIRRGNELPHVYDI